MALPCINIQCRPTPEMWQGYLIADDLRYLANEADVAIVTEGDQKIFVYDVPAEGEDVIAAEDGTVLTDEEGYNIAPDELPWTRSPESPP